MILVSWTGLDAHPAPHHRRLRRAATQAMLAEAARELGRPEPRLHRSPGRAPRPEPPGLHVSIAHAGRLTVCAVAEHGIGVDLELRGTAREERLAAGPPARFFTAAELRAVEEDPAELLRAFTAKEAWAKLLGRGLALGFGGFDEQSVRAARPDIAFSRPPIPGAVCTVCHRAGEPIRVRERKEPAA